MKLKEVKVRCAILDSNDSPIFTMVLLDIQDQIVYRDKNKWFFQTTKWVDIPMNQVIEMIWEK